MDLSGQTLLIAGCGNMGSALALGARGLEGLDVLLYDVDPAKSTALADQDAGDAVDSLAEASADADLVLLAIKPQQLPEFLKANASSFRKDQILISILAGVPTSKLAIALPCRIVRAMPNTPALVDEGMTSLCGSDEDALLAAEEIFGCVGVTARIPENQMDAVTALSGSGPAYLFFFAEALMAAAAGLSIDPETARTLVRQTLLGAARLLDQSPDDAGTLRLKVTSPGGTTEAALRVLEERRFKDIVVTAVRAAADRSRELGR